MGKRNSSLSWKNVIVHEVNSTGFEGVNDHKFCMPCISHLDACSLVFYMPLFCSRIVSVSVKVRMLDHIQPMVFLCSVLV